MISDRITVTGYFGIKTFDAGNWAIHDRLYGRYMGDGDTELDEVRQLAELVKQKEMEELCQKALSDYLLKESGRCGL